VTDSQEHGKIIKISSINRIILYHILGIFGKLKVKGGQILLKMALNTITQTFSYTRIDGYVREKPEKDN
jgi:hypothetical protein